MFIRYWLAKWVPVAMFVAAVGVGWAMARGSLTLISSAGAMELALAHAEIAPVFTGEVQHWRREIATWAERYGLEPDLVAAVMQIESCGAPEAVSSAGARGLFQVMPFHFEKGENMVHPETNASRGLPYLKEALRLAAGEVELALAGYNGGHGQIGRSRSQWPAETRRYVYWGSGLYADARSGLTSSPRLEEWLRAGGASLCRQAAAELGLAP